MTDIHSTAIVAEGAQLGDGVTVGPYSIVGANVELGDGVVLHSLRHGATETPPAFRFGTDRKDRVYGQVVPVDRPVALSGGDLRGLFDKRHDRNGALIGGELRLRWPEGADGQSVRLSVMKETFIRVGPRKNGVAKVKLGASDHLYLAGQIDFGPGLRSAVINATCAPEAP